MRGPYDQGGIGKRPMFKWTVNKKADVLRIIDNVMPWLGERRAARAQELIGFADALPGHNSDKTHCIHGHPFSGDNLYEWRGKRVCKTCKSARQVERKNRLVA
jgi:hypothetical protein